MRVNDLQQKFADQLRSPLKDENHKIERSWYKEGEQL